jgi:hypothetical protein
MLVYDLRGALVARPFDEVFPRGTHERAWSFEASAKRIRPGIYFARLITDHGTADAKIVIAP